ncbi:MAG: hypothetical protein U9R40_07655 [Synergistota bacterium]|nr:hypothetical protein [Synergistota bacterium]
MRKNDFARREMEKLLNRKPPWQARWGMTVLFVITVVVFLLLRTIYT